MALLRLLGKLKPHAIPVAAGAAVGAGLYAGGRAIHRRNEVRRMRRMVIQYPEAFQQLPNEDRHRLEEYERRRAGRQDFWGRRREGVAAHIDPVLAGAVVAGTTLAAQKGWEAYKKSKIHRPDTVDRIVKPDMGTEDYLREHAAWLREKKQE